MLVPALLAVSAVKDFLIIGCGTVAYFKYIRPIHGRISNVIDFFQGKNVQKLEADAPKPVKELASELQKAFSTFDQSPTKAKDLAEDALISFFSKDKHEAFVSSLLHQELLDLLSHIGEKEKIVSCLEKLELEINTAQGDVTKVKKVGHSLKRATKTVSINLLRSAVPHPDEPTPSSLQRIRDLQKQPDSPLKERLLKYHLNKLGFKEVTLQSLDGHIKSFILNVLHIDPEGFSVICKKISCDSRFFGVSSGTAAQRDDFFIAYKRYRQEKPILSPIPAEFNWKTETNLETEQEKALDLASCFATLVVFKMRYGSDPLTQTGFHTVLSKTYHKTPEERQKLVLQFFQEERERLGTAWVPWSVDKQIFETIYKLVNYSSFKCLTSSPLLDNLKETLKESPIPSMIYIGEKTSRFFHYLVNKYNEWSQSYTYDMAQDDFLKMKLYKRQEQSQGSMNLDFFLSRLDIIGRLRHLSDTMYRWACRPCLGKNHTFVFLNPAIVLVKQASVLPLRLISHLLILPALVIQWLLNLTFMSAMEHVIVHTPLFEKIDEVVTEAILNPTPYHFSLLEVVLKNLKEVLEIIEESSGQALPSNPKTNRAKRALKETVRTFVACAKMQESLSTEDKPFDQMLFEKVLPPAMDKIYDTILRVYTGYTEREKLEKRGTEILQALNYYNYNKHRPTENMEVLEKRVIEVRNQIELYIKKIAHALIIETSNEEISEDVGKALKEFLSGAEDAAFSPLTESYLNRNKGLFIDLIRKSYIMKGLFVHLITEDKIPSTQ
ncbi:hypothetical protein [Simkania negevensis]|uniref:Uncharacterized protein n=1 Tax=Simkania negevensis (strain ATCC VR-1471 / DSM 27360 / Z) TaxID=331113 RepID=F8L7K4_SIMNZ|nr:hypothetical protein [Simkania negevensis]CCB88737.1 unknown protein [Simkania negevensis Z]